jgi:hypothetical protein
MSRNISGSKLAVVSSALCQNLIRDHTIAASSWVFIITPSSSNLASPLENDEVSRFVLSDHIDGIAHPLNSNQRLSCFAPIIVTCNVPEIPAPMMTTAAFEWLSREAECTFMSYSGVKPWTEARSCCAMNALSSFFSILAEML